MRPEQPDVMGTYLDAGWSIDGDGVWHEPGNAPDLVPPLTEEVIELLRDLDRLHAGGLDRDEWMARKRVLIERIEPGFYEREADR